MLGSKLAYFFVLAEENKVDQAEVKLFYIKYSNMGMTLYCMEIRWFTKGKYLGIYKRQEINLTLELLST